MTLVCNYSSITIHIIWDPLEILGAHLPCKLTTTDVLCDAIMLRTSPSSAASTKKNPKLRLIKTNFMVYIWLLHKTALNKLLLFFDIFIFNTLNYISHLLSHKFCVDLYFVGNFIKCQAQPLNYRFRKTCIKKREEIASTSLILSEWNNTLLWSTKIKCRGFKTCLVKRNICRQTA